ncbi:MAG: hypothetical protein MMC33_006637 [Icmadophila ericetorum]|nr:hypothetical protein [Icmadophila ericetorum]
MLLYLVSIYCDVLRFAALRCGYYFAAQRSYTEHCSESATTISQIPENLTASHSALTYSASTNCASTESSYSRRYSVLSILDINRIPSLAVAVRNARESRSFLVTDCTVTNSALRGSSNILLPIIFSDGQKWIIKFPRHGHPDRFGELDAQALRSEALTMRLIKRETYIPIPELYAFDASFQNGLGCTYLLMEYIDGLPLNQTNQWLDETVSELVLEERRIRILDQIAEAVVQLNQLTFSQGGQLFFDKMGDFARIGGFKRNDWLASIENMFHGMKDNESELLPEVQEFSQPFTDPKTYMLCMLKASNYSFEIATDTILRMFTDWAFEGYADRRFVLSHPDLDLQNILVSPEGEVHGLIDWDGVESVPWILGQVTYPKMLTIDWHHLNFTCKEDKPNPYTISPDELARYRVMYHQCKSRYQANLSHRNHDAFAIPNLADDQEHKPMTAQRSLVLDMLWTAANDGSRKSEIMNEMFNKLTSCFERKNNPKESLGRQQTKSDSERIFVEIFPEDPKNETTDTEAIEADATKICVGEDEKACLEANTVESDIDHDNKKPTKQDSRFPELVQNAESILRAFFFGYIRSIRLTYLFLGEVRKELKRRATVTKKTAEVDSDDEDKKWTEEERKVFFPDPKPRKSADELFVEYLERDPDRILEHRNFDLIGLALAETKVTKPLYTKKLREGFDMLCA